VTLFYGTLRENIAFGLLSADDSAIVAAAEVAGMTDFVNRHPRGFDMTVGERGESLSGGATTKRRIGARSAAQRAAAACSTSRRARWTFRPRRRSPRA